MKFQMFLVGPIGLPGILDQHNFRDRQVVAIGYLETEPKSL